MMHCYRSLLVATALLLGVGCDGHVRSAPTPKTPSPPTTAAPAATAQTTPLADPDAAAFAGEIAGDLARELALDAATEERVRSSILGAWEDVQAEVAQRVQAGGGDLDSEALTALFAERQRSLDAEIAAGLTPTQRLAFFRLGGQVDAGPSEEDSHD